MNGVIYCLTSPSGKKYIGQTTRFRLRMNGHNTDRLNPAKKNLPLYLAISKYGWQNFTKEKLVEGVDDPDLLNLLECEFIAQYLQDGHELYNLTSGGEGTLGWCPPVEWRERRSENSRTQWRDPEYAKRQRESRIDSWKDEDRLSAVSARATGENNVKAKLTERQAKEILERLKTETVQFVAKEFGVNNSTIFNLRAGRTWKYLPRPNYDDFPIKTKVDERRERVAAEAELIKNRVGIIKWFLSNGYRNKHVALFSGLTTSSIARIKTDENYPNIPPTHPAQKDFEVIDRIVAENPLRAPQRRHTNAMQRAE